MSPEKGAARELLQRAAKLIAAAGKQALADVSTAHLAGLKLKTTKTLSDLAEAVDLLLVVGGDGTMLGAARGVSHSSTPILGINTGGLGFLTEVQAQQMGAAFKQLWAGEYEIEERSLIHAIGSAAGHPISLIALNDFVISRGAVSRLIELDVFINEQSLTRYRCDGLIISSPTGSTAYSLAAGGAVVSPDAEVLTLTPICPHTLSNRSVIVRLDAVVRIEALSGKVDMFLTADGQEQLALQSGDSITIRQSDRSVRLVRLPGSSFFDTLRQKLNWRGSHVTH
ncbi:MAG TPA: NAD(+)/NADH kinase [Methylomirabilota bacterium]|nr:NAD(+)/NADH kinase [Methylomirabilota bacterium]